MKLSIRDLIICSLFASVTAILAQISIPIPFTTVPLTMQVFAIMLCGMLLGSKLGFISQVIYLLIGAIGMPVFAQMRGGLGVLLGPTGGFLVSFPIAAFIVGYFSQKYKSKLSVILGMVLGLVIIYIIGTLQFCLITKVSFMSGIMACVLPFAFTDLIKIGLAYVIGSSIYKRVNIGIRTC
ncbi:biotin transporter BioY [Romboutsia sp.]|uniref:biotin transporter BioY n=1 Tax=Romboutsia sp. TaxID=1965302 RepID=UPI002B6F5E74|nr:biotin transporter BioY [Romboutsia sp.]HSQ89924.1 biotin transporter BioY [Romboutsia sp.]